MSVYELLIIPILFGLVGFFEPCSLGINLIFLNRIKSMAKTVRIRESVIFTVIRAVILALVGLTAAFLGSKIITFQVSLFVILGIVYVLVGIVAIVNRYHPIFTIDINLAKYVRRRGALSLGVVFGLVIPACAIALVVALIGRAIIVGNLVEGFVSLFIFGLALSSPLILISFFEKSNKIVQRLSIKARKIPWLSGAILILVGLLTMLTSVWWTGAIQ